jgi:hypothetical protein
MARNSSEPLSFMDQVMEICDRILDRQPRTDSNTEREKAEETDETSDVSSHGTSRP